jgi:hypothetical protein
MIPTVLTTIVFVPQLAVLLLFVPDGSEQSAAWIMTGAFTFGSVLRLIAIKRVIDVKISEILIPGKPDIVLIISNPARIARSRRQHKLQLQKTIQSV